MCVMQMLFKNLTFFCLRKARVITFRLIYANYLNLHSTPSDLDRVYHNHVGYVELRCYKWFRTLESGSINGFCLFLFLRVFVAAIGDIIFLLTRSLSRVIENLIVKVLVKEW